MAVGIRLQWYGGRYKNLHKHDREFRREVLSGERGLNVGNILFIDATFTRDGAPFYHEPADPSKVVFAGIYDGAADLVVNGNGDVLKPGNHWNLTERGDAKLDQTNGMTSKLILFAGTKDATKPGSIKVEAPHPDNGEIVTAEIKIPKLD